MTEEYIYERERDMLDYFRNNMTDPSSRGTDDTQATTGTGGQTLFALDNVLVKNVADTITVDATTYRKGTHYTVSYGAGTAASSITFSTAPGAGELAADYHYGPFMVEREFSRSDAALPRIVIMFLTGSEELAALGDGIESGKGSYFNASYRIEVRSKYAQQAREIASKAFNLGNKMRHAVLFRTNMTTSTDLQNFNFDPDKDAYLWQFTLSIQWEILFE